MPIIVENKSQPRELIPAGNYIARCYQMLDLGTHEGEYQGKKNINRKVRIGWEFPLELKTFSEEKGPQPLVFSKEYNVSMGEKANLRKDLESWRGKAFTPDELKGFDITKLINKVCMINIIHKPSESDPTKIYEKIASISPLPKGTVCPDQINQTLLMEFDKPEEYLLKFEKLPQWLKDQIMASPEYNEICGNDNMPNASDGSQEVDDLPF